MNRLRASIARFVYVMMLTKGMDKDQALRHLADVQAFDDEMWVTFLNELALMFSNELDKEPTELN